MTKIRSKNAKSDKFEHFRNENDKKNSKMTEMTKIRSKNVKSDKFEQFRNAKNTKF